MMYRFDGIDYFKMSKEIDVASWDNYPTWHKPSETVEETALDTALMHDLYYSMKGRPFLLMESSPSFTNWQPISKQKHPGIAELAALQTVAHGSDSVLYFQWRASGVRKKSSTVQSLATMGGRMPAPSGKQSVWAKSWKCSQRLQQSAAQNRQRSSTIGKTSGHWKVPAALEMPGWATGTS